MKKTATHLLFFLPFVLLLTQGCKTDTTDQPEIKPSQKNRTTDTFSQPQKEYDEDIEILFNSSSSQIPTVKNSFEDSLLQAVKICNPQEKDLKNYRYPACNPKFFKILPTVSGATKKDHFLILCKSGVAGFPMRRVIVYEREGNDYIISNTFLADIIGFEKNPHSDHKDLILQFMDEDENRFECLYSWKQGRYSYQKVLKINRSRIKAEYVDSMKVVIANEIKRMKLSY